MESTEVGKPDGGASGLRPRRKVSAAKASSASFGSVYPRLTPWATNVSPASRAVPRGQPTATRNGSGGEPGGRRRPFDFAPDKRRCYGSPLRGDCAGESPASTRE